MFGNILEFVESAQCPLVILLGISFREANFRVVDFLCNLDNAGQNPTLYNCILDHVQSFTAKPAVYYLFGSVVQFCSIVAFVHIVL